MTKYEIKIKVGQKKRDGLDELVNNAGSVTGRELMKIIQRAKKALKKEGAEFRQAVTTFKTRMKYSISWDGNGQTGTLVPDPRHFRRMAKLREVQNQAI